VNNELEKTWKEAVMSYFRYYYDICLEGLRKTTKTPARSSASSQDSDRRPPKDKPEASLLDKLSGNDNYDGLDIQQTDETWEISDRKCLKTYLEITTEHLVC
jgi:hypothetical protein